MNGDGPCDAPGMTPDARAAFARAGFSRRELLTRSGALVVGFSVSGLAARLGLVPAALAQPSRGAEAPLDGWVAIAGDGAVTAYTGKCELGHGLSTAQVQLIAEELCVPVARVSLVMCDTAVTPDQGTTSGSQSHPSNFNQRNLAQACATAREALVRMAADRLKVPADRLSVADGVVAVEGAPSRRVGYGDLIGGRRFDIPVSETARRKPKGEWTVLGTSVPRLDLPALVAAEAEFVHTIRVPGMLHGQVVRPPTVGAHLKSVDEASIRDLPGVVKLVVKKDFVGVVAEKPWQAIQAARRLQASWTSGAALPDQRGFYEHLRRQQPARDTWLVNSHDIDAKLAGAAAVVEATYLHPYQMHGSIGSSCAVADVKGDSATIWSATQSVYPQRDTTAMILGLAPEKVRVVFVRGSGCYGLNGADTVCYDAALLSQAVGRPVRVQLSRKDEMAWENYGYAYVVDQRAGLDADGAIVAWEYEAWFPVLGSRPGYGAPGNVVTGRLAGFEPRRVQPRSPAPEPTSPLNNGSNAAPSYIAGCVGPTCGGAGTVRSERVLTHVVDSVFWTGPLRSPSRLQNTFAHESFMDELAARAAADPVAFRLRHLSDTRVIDVVNAAAKASGWEPRPSPKRARPPSGVARGRGIACVAYEGHNGYSAMVADVEVDQQTGRIAVKRLVVGQDCGPVSNPDGLRNQVEGGALQGLSRALGEEVTWDEQSITSIDWRSYHTLTLGFEPPAIETVLLDRGDEVPATGAGETTITVVAAAVGNAVFDATGVRLREVPFTAARVKAALDGRS